MSERTPPVVCPLCAQRGRKLTSITLESQLLPETVAQAAPFEGYHFCAQVDCDAVYFGSPTQPIYKTQDLHQLVYQKSPSKERLACYCFHHSVSELEREVGENGSSKVPAEIKEKCKAGLDACAIKNPQGVCCLGNVRQVVKAALATSQANQSERGAAQSAASTLSAPSNTDDNSKTATPDCCKESIFQEEPPGQNAAASSPTKTGRLSLVGAVFAALLSSACCWLPLFLIAVGASAAGVAGFFERYRHHFLALSVLLLMSGFYFVFFVRGSRCAPGEACSTKRPKLLRLNRWLLGSASAFVLLFAAFPHYVTYLLEEEEPRAPFLATSPLDAPSKTRTSPEQQYPLEERVFTVTGMTCEGCTQQAIKALKSIEGVQEVRVSYPKKTATLRLRRNVSNDAIAQSLKELGYQIAPTTLNKR